MRLFPSINHVVLGEANKKLDTKEDRNFIFYGTL